MKVYLDNNATTYLIPEVKKSIRDILNNSLANPSSVHSDGAAARELLEAARWDTAALIGTIPEQVFFTSGATESNNQILQGICRVENTRKKIVTTTVEHSSILNTCAALEQMGHEVVYIPVNSQGQIDLDDFYAAVKGGATLASVQWVNNETGILQPIRELGEICRREDVLFHTDAAQAVGKFNIDVENLPIDFLSLTGHKIHAPKGIGAIYCRQRTLLPSFIFGGPQEQGQRAGTENLLGIVGLGTACRVRMRVLSEFVEQTSALVKRFEDQVLSTIADMLIIGERSERVCNTTNLMFCRTDGQALVAQLDSAGISCSQSSACTSSRPEPSYVLRAMGFSEQEAYDCVRFSFSSSNQPSEVDYVVSTITDISVRLRSVSDGVLTVREEVTV